MTFSLHLMRSANSLIVSGAEGWLSAILLSKTGGAGGLSVMAALRSSARIPSKSRHDVFARIPGRASGSLRRPGPPGGATRPEAFWPHTRAHIPFPATSRFEAHARKTCSGQPFAASGLFKSASARSIALSRSASARSSAARVSIRRRSSNSRSASSSLIRARSCFFVSAIFTSGRP
jgi:hypothetical protein